MAGARDCVTDPTLLGKRKPAGFARRPIGLIGRRAALHALVLRASPRLFRVVLRWILILLSRNTVLLSHLSLHSNVTDVCD